MQTNNAFWQSLRKIAETGSSASGHGIHDLSLLESQLAQNLFSYKCALRGKKWYFLRLRTVPATRLENSWKLWKQLPKETESSKSALAGFQGGAQTWHVQKSTTDNKYAANPLVNQHFAWSSESSWSQLTSPYGPPIPCWNSTTLKLLRTIEALACSPHCNRENLFFWIPDMHIKSRYCTGPSVVAVTSPFWSNAARSHPQLAGIRNAISLLQSDSSKSNAWLPKWCQMSAALTWDWTNGFIS